MKIIFQTDGSCLAYWLSQNFSHICLMQLHLYKTRHLPPHYTVCPSSLLYSDSLYKVGQDFVDLQYNTIFKQTDRVFALLVQHCIAMRGSYFTARLKVFVVANYRLLAGLQPLLPTTGSLPVYSALLPTTGSLPVNSHCCQLPAPCRFIAVVSIMFLGLF